MTCFKHTGRRHTPQQGLHHKNYSWTEKSVHDLTTTQQRDLTGKKKSGNETANRKRKSNLTMTEDTELKNTSSKSERRFFWNAKRNAKHTRFEPYIYIATKVIQIEAAQNSLHPSKRQTKANTYCKTSSITSSQMPGSTSLRPGNNTSDNTNSHPRHCYPTSANCYTTSANWRNTYQSNPTTAQITATEHIHIWWSSEGLHQINVELTLNIDQMLSTMVMNTEHLFRYNIDCDYYLINTIFTVSKLNKYYWSGPC